MTEVIGLTADSLLEKEKNDRIVMELELKKRAFETVVPTLPAEVQEALRYYNQPIRIFGEDASDIRQRLRIILAYRSLLQDRPQSLKLLDDEGLKPKPTLLTEEHRLAVPSTSTATTSTTTTYTHASLSLIEARQSICTFSLRQAKKRLQTERYRRSLHQHQQQQQQAVTASTNHHQQSQLFQHATKLTLEASHYGDTRTLSALCTLHSHNTINHDNAANHSSYVLTASWNATLQMWKVPTFEDTNNRIIQLCCTRSIAHHDRIMGISSYSTSFNNFSSNSDPSSTALGFLATSSIDLTAKLWKVLLPPSHDQLEEEEEENHNPMQQQQSLIQELLTLRGHQQRLCKTCFHPNGTHVITTSFDTTWRLWDITRENDHELLLQDGHDRETYGIGMHPDGSIVSITDFAGIVRLWDLRSGKNILHFLVCVIITVH
jgi:U4/U6 small nuclear ribonucleoprotein PRP4